MTPTSKPPAIETTNVATALEPPSGYRGLTSDEVRARLREYGPNLLVPEERKASWLLLLLKPFSDPMVLLLLVAGITYFFLGDYPDMILVLVAVVPVALVSAVLEARAERALKQLKQLTAPTANVWRDEGKQLIPAEDIVPGDLLFVQEGDLIPADGELIAGVQLMSDEASLTGESQPVVKELMGSREERQLFAGTTALSGRGLIQVTATGQRTRYGHIGVLLSEIRQPATPLEHLIRKLVRQLVFVAAGFCVGVATLELVRGQGWGAAIIAGISLAIAAVPEEFPMVFTLYLTLGAWRLAKRGALIRRLAGVETLGSTTVICSDKTGTLTLGHLEVKGLYVNGKTYHAGERLGPEARKLLEAAILASEPNPFDPLEQAILRFATAHGIDVTALHQNKLVKDYAFEPIQKYMTHIWQRDGEFAIYAKGSTEGILTVGHADDTTRQGVLEANQQFAASGMRVIAVAQGKLSSPSSDRAQDEQGLTFVGLVAFSDPLRPGVAEALNECREAGIRVLMITGDHPVTAHAVADDLGLPHRHDVPIATGDDLDAWSDEALAERIKDITLFARIRPEQKYRLVKALKSQQEVVAMTGDGVNDAPALHEADIGVAMGKRGTEVARSAATLVLLDDNFATIVSAVRDGRRIFENLQRAFAYLIAFHLPLLLLALVVPLLGLPLMLLPAHLILLELIVHPVVSLVFEADPEASDLMRRPPRRASAGLLSRAELLQSLALGSTLFIGVLALYLLTWNPSGLGDNARALAFTTLLLGQLLLVLVQRSPTKPLWQSTWKGNWALPWVVSVTLLSILAILYLPVLANLLKLTPLSLQDWGLALAIALLTTLWLEPVKAWRRRGRS